MMVVSLRPTMVEALQPLVHVALLRPKIPQNTGNIGRLVCAMGARLHLIGPLGFQTDERACRRAGLDYWQHLDWVEHTALEALSGALPAGARTFVFSTRATRYYTDVDYRAGDCLLFGDEVSGLPSEVVEAAGERAVRIPLRCGAVRSLNLANATAIAVAEVARQLGHPQATGPRRPSDPRALESSSCKRT